MWHEIHSKADDQVRSCVTAAQGYAVLSVDTDIVLFKNPLDKKFNPWMNRELDIWTAIDNGRMLNCGFYFLHPTEPVRIG